MHGVLQTREIKSKTTCKRRGHSSLQWQLKRCPDHATARVFFKSGGTECGVAELFNIFDPAFMIGERHLNTNHKTFTYVAKVLKSSIGSFLVAPSVGRLL